MNEYPSIKGATVARTVILALALLNQILATSGKVPLGVSEQEIYSLVSTAFTIAAACVAWWKNNSFTKEARLSDQYLASFRDSAGDE